ncbi:MAG: hypothetical protein IT374_23980 [Polyangiaceae bacterium]|nr:hypothetical protein [Polyangiaceae bacterium]
MSLKERLTQEGMKLMSDPRMMKLMQDERFMKLMMAAMSMPGKVSNFTDEQKEGIAKSMGFAQEREVRDLRRTVRALEAEVTELKKKLAAAPK